MLTHVKGHMRIPLLLAAAAVVIAPPRMSAQEVTLQDAIAMAQRQGTAGQIARSSRAAARYRNDAFNSRLLPQLFLTGDAANYNHGINPITLPDGSTAFIGQSQNQSSMQVGFSQRIPLTGGLVSVGEQVKRFDEFGNLNNRSWQTS